MVGLRRTLVMIAPNPVMSPARIKIVLDELPVRGSAGDGGVSTATVVTGAAVVGVPAVVVGA